MTWRPIRWVAGLAAVALVGFLVYGAWPRPLPSHKLALLMEGLAARSDTAALARLARRQCGGVDGVDPRRTCYEEFFLALSGRDRVRLALGALSRLGDRDGKVKADGHVYTHVIGIRAWQPGTDVARVFSSCTGLYQSGCYHGVIQAYLTGGGDVDSARVAGLCDLIERSVPDRWLRFQCVHGVGHGLEMIWNWDLPRSLAGCDWLVTPWDREGCYGGAFMENAVASMPGGHHTSARVIAETQAADAASEHREQGGHAGHAPDPATITFRMRDSADALYPCSIVGEQYLSSCYMLQGGLILQRTGFDFERATEECDRAPEIVRHNCYLSLGTSASGITVRNARRVIAHCSHGDPGYQPWCFVGAAKNFVDVTADPEDGFRLCRLVPEGKNRRQCWVAVGEQIMVLHVADRTARERTCIRAGGDGVLDCRYGASLLDVPPPGLPIRPGDPGS